MSSEEGLMDVTPRLWPTSPCTLFSFTAKVVLRHPYPACHQTSDKPEQDVKPLCENIWSQLNNPPSFISCFPSLTPPTSPSLSLQVNFHDMLKEGLMNGRALP